jgi:hypothetical protein
VQRLGEPTHEQGLTTKSYTPDWILETVKATESDHRRQPWREAFTEAIDSRFDDEEDLVRVEPAVGVEIDPACPFRTQGSSLAA